MCRVLGLGRLALRPALLQSVQETPPLLEVRNFALSAVKPSGLLAVTPALSGRAVTQPSG